MRWNVKTRELKSRERRSGGGRRSVLWRFKPRPLLLLFSFDLVLLPLLLPVRVLMFVLSLQNEYLEGRSQEREGGIAAGQEFGSRR